MEMQCTHIFFTNVKKDELNFVFEIYLNLLIKKKKQFSQNINFQNTLSSVIVVVHAITLQSI